MPERHRNCRVRYVQKQEVENFDTIQQEVEEQL